jgi:ribosomal protein S18 acetylase RimI-like enzyme
MSDAGVTVTDAESSEEIRQTFARLIPQLSASAPVPGPAEISEMLAAKGTSILIAREGPLILGAITLIVVRTPTGLRAQIESLVVDTAARRRGVGEALCRAALARAVDAGADSVDLTSAPSRAAANRLYLRLGFERRDTNVYRYRPRP